MRNKPKNIQNLFNYRSKSFIFKEFISIGLTIILILSIFSSIFLPILSAEDTLESPLGKETKEVDTVDSSSEKDSFEHTVTETSTEKTSESNSEQGASPEKSETEESSTESEVKETPIESTETSSDPEKETVQSETTEFSSTKSTDDASKNTVSTTSLTSQKTVSVTEGDSTSEIKSYVSTNSNDLLSSNTDEINNSSGIISNNIIKFSNTFILEEKNESSDNNTEKQFSSSIGNIATDQTITIFSPEITVEESFSTKPKTRIEKVEFTAKSSKNNVEFSVKNLKEKPEEVKMDMSLSSDSEVYEYLDIKLTSDGEYIGESGIKSMNFTFTVHRSWIENNDIDKETVTMLRYHNDTWQELNTTYLNETDDEMTFEAITPGLSIFAVVGDKVVEESDEIIVDTTNVPWWMPATVIFASTATLGLVLFKKRFVYNP